MINQKESKQFRMDSQLLKLLSRDMKKKPTTTTTTTKDEPLKNYKKQPKKNI